MSEQNIQTLNKKFVKNRMDIIGLKHFTRNLKGIIYELDLRLEQQENRIERLENRLFKILEEKNKK